MALGWTSEDWNRDREESQLEDLQHTPAADKTENISLKDWLSARARHVPSLPRGIRPDQTPDLKTDTVEGVSEPRYLEDWLNSRTRNVGTIRGTAVNLTSGFTRPTFVPNPTSPPFTPRASPSVIAASSSSLSHGAECNLMPAITQPAEPKISPIRVTSGQVFLALTRLVLEVNWDFFHANSLLFDMSEIPTERSQQWWNHVCQVYDQYCHWTAQGVDALMELYKEFKADDQVLGIEQTILNPIMRFLIGYKAGCSGEARGRAALDALLLEGDFLTFVIEWCEENGLTYPGGTGRTSERLEEYAVESSADSEENCS